MKQYRKDLAMTLMSVALTWAVSVNAKSLVAGWNLLGNSFTQPIAVSTGFSDSTLFNTVWAWDAVNLKWNFFTPAMTSTELQAYANSKGYGVLSQIQPEDGYWVNAKIATTLILTPTCANDAIDYPACTPPSTGTIPTVAQGGLTWVNPNYASSCGSFTCTYNWSTANSSCTTTINGQTGWRLPTQPELTSLAQSGIKSGGGGVWSSTPTLTPTYHYYVSLNGTTGTALSMADASYLYVLCVR